MPALRIIFKISLSLLLSIIFITGIAGCTVANISQRIEQSPEISALPAPKLPDWIEQISPLGETTPLNQIRIRFKEALIPIESLDNDNQQELLQKFTVVPPLAGRFRFLTPRMVGFQADKALPKATIFKVTLKSGLGDLKNHKLEQDLEWTFNTETIKLTNLPTSNPENSEKQPIDLKPTLQFTSNVELDLTSLQDNLQLIPEGKKNGVHFDVKLDKQETPVKDEEQPEVKFDPSARNYIYSITTQQTLEKATRYRLEFAAGLRPLYGNLLTTAPFISQVETYSPLKFQGIKLYGQPDSNGTYGRFIKGSPQLEFNNGLVVDSAMENITINPPPKQAAKLVQSYENDNLVSLNPWILEPLTTYTITIGDKLKDKFGQILDKSVSVKYETGDVAGDIFAPSGLHIFPSGQDLQLNITTVNLPESKYKATYKVVQSMDLVYSDSAYPQGEGKDLLPKPNAWQSFRVSGKKNQSTDINIPLKSVLKASTGMLAYGVQAKTNTYQDNKQQKWRESATYGMVQLTNLGVFSQWFPESGLIRVHHLSDGLPVVSASVDIYESKLEAKSTSRSKPIPCASGKTDVSGTLRLNREDLKQCIKSDKGFKEAPKLLVIARENQDWAFARSEEYSGAYGYGIYPGWDDGKPESRGVIFSDRKLYQPGEKAAFTAMAYYLQNGALKQDKNTSYKVTLARPDGQKIDLGLRKTNEFGTFSLELPIQNNQALGYYTISAKGENEAEISGEFRVAEFKPPNFKVALALNKEFALIGEQIESKAESNYLFGAPVESGKSQYYVTREKTTFIPKNWENFSFGRQWFYPEETPIVTTDVLQTTGVLDKEGKINQIVTVEKDLPYPMTYRVDVQISDVSNLAVADSKKFTALPSDRIIGLQSNFVADAGKPLPIQVIVTEPTGKTIADQKVRIELEEMKYSSVTRLVEGSATAKNQIQYQKVGEIEVKSSATPETVSLIPPKSASYRIRANFVDAKNELTATDLQIWATGDNTVEWGSKDKNRLEIKLDKKTYKPGETATALIQSPYSEGELYFAVVRDKPLYQQILKVKGGAPQIQFQVTPEMLPNAAVEAVLVRQGMPLNQVEPGSLENLVRIGFAPFETSLEDKYLKVLSTIAQQKLEPGAEQTLQLELRDNQGNPIRGQFTVMVVNDAILQLSGYRPPDVVKTVYAEQLISTRFSDNRPDVVLQPTKLQQKGWGYGGGLSLGAANTRIRKNFQPLAYYNGAILSDSNGKAEVTFKLPDDLTTWRVMTVATDGNLRFGNAESTFISTKSLISNPILPQFARPGDRILAGLSVTNNTGETGTLSIQGAVTKPLEFADNQTGNLQTPVESGTQAYRFPIIANSSGESQVQFVTKLNGISDAFEIPLQIKPLEITEQVVESGTLPPSPPLKIWGEEVKIPLNIDKNVVIDTGGLDVSLASSLITEIKAPAKQVLEDDNLPLLETISSQLIIAANLQTLAKQYNQPLAEFNPIKQAAQSLEKLAKLQMPDGGFAFYPKSKNSDPFVTPYTAQALAQTRQTFPKLVDTQMISALTGYLKKLLANPAQYEFCQQQICKNQIRLNTLIALAQLSEKRNDFLADIYKQRSQLDIVTQIKLARYLSQFSAWKKEAETLAKSLQQNLYETGRTATISLPQSWRWMNSQTVAQSQSLRLAITQKVKPEILDRLLQSLLSLRRNGVWECTYNNAEALTALVEYSKLQPTPPNFNTTVQLAGKKLAETRFEGYKNPSLDVKIPMADLPRGRNDLIIKKSGSGMLHYLAAYRYRLPGNQPGRFNGLRVNREIRAANQEKVLQKITMYAKDEPLTVQAGQVYDIGLEIITDHPVNHLVITDPLPAGFEAVDASFQTSTPYFQSQGDSWQLGFKTIYSDRIVAYSEQLDPGVYSLHYLVRSVTPGTFLWSGAEVHLQYSPEEFGRSASSTLMVK